MPELSSPAAPLDTTTFFPSGDAAEVDPSTGESLDGYALRLRRWELQATARRLLRDVRSTRRNARKQGHRIATCHRDKLPSDDEGVRVYRRDDGATYYAGLMVCGSVWACPICAAKVSERRRRELRAALERWREGGGEVLMLTLTVPHTIRAAAFDLADKLMHICERLNSGGTAVSRLVPGYVGQVRALEVTHGQNGWHPHLHVLLFLSRALSTEEFLRAGKAIWCRWADLVDRAGLGIASARAFSIQDGSAAAEYVAKFGREQRWGMAEEVTKAVVKQARSASGRAPFALLADASQGDAGAGRLFVEYVRAFTGRRQLRWSRGLRDRLGLGAERTDEEDASARDELDQLLARISDADWALIVARELRGVALEILRTGNLKDFEHFVRMNAN